MRQPLDFRDGDDLRAWMDATGRTMRGLAAELEVSRSTVERWRTSAVPMDKLIMLALEHLECDE